MPHGRRSEAVVNPDFRAHDHANLYLPGRGVFPTGGASTPTLTLAALALRAVDQIRRTLSSP
jgi:choline dehydrogenase-like flavoprotein